MEELLKKLEEQIEELSKKVNKTPEEKQLLINLIKEAIYLRDIINTRAALD
jgi:hypothetical protein